jgi:hypothetical protein
VTELPIDQSILQHIETFDRALIQADYDAVRKLTTREFTIIHPLGQQSAKEAWLEWLLANVRYYRIDRSGVKVRAHEPVVVVTSQVRSMIAVQGLFDGESRAHETIRSEIWVRQSQGVLLDYVHLTHAAG